MLRDGLVERPDGRVVAWSEWGDPAGRPLLRAHGTPGSRLTGPFDPELYERIQAHVVTFDRPGYGRSSVHREGTVLSVADDALAVADAVGWDRFAVHGGSGGGPYAPAVGFRGGDRVSAVGLVNPGAPSELAADVDMLAHNREVRRCAKEEGREAMEAFLDETARALIADPNEALSASMADAPVADRVEMTARHRRTAAIETLREAFANGPQGWYDDTWRLLQPWGYRLGDVSAPVHIWAGEQDRNSPLVAVGRMAEQLPAATLEVLPDTGHLGWRPHEERILRTLLG